MSASREKKQRQGGTPSDKTLTAKQQAEESRRKTIRYTVIGVVVAVLVAALLIWNTGFFQARATAVTVDGTNYSVAQADYFYHSTQTYQMTRYYGSMMGFDSTKSPRDQAYGEDGGTYHDQFMKDALTQMTTITALYNEAVKNGVTAADVKDQVAQRVEAAKADAAKNSLSYKQYLTAMYGSYVTPSVFEDCLTRTYIAGKGQTDYQDSLDYTQEQLDAYYNEHADEMDTFRYCYLYFTPEAVETTDADGNEIEMTDEEKTAAEEKNLTEAKLKAENAKAALEEGKSVADVIEEFAPTNQAEGTETEGGSLSSAYSQWLTDSARKAGDVTVAENASSGYYVVVFEERTLDKTPTANTRHILIQAEISDDASAPTEEQMAAAKTKAEELLSQWKAGAATEDSFAELANANSDDSGSNTNGGLYEDVYKGRFVPNYNEWLFDSARQPGDTAVVENNGTSYYGYHVVYYVGQNPDFVTWMAKAKEDLIQADSSSWLEGLQENCTAEEAGGAKYLGK